MRSSYSNTMAHTLFIWFFLILLVSGVHAEDNQDPVIKRTAMLLPVQNLTANSEYKSWAYAIYNVLEINLKNQESLNVISYDSDTFGPVDTADIVSLIRTINERLDVEVAITCEYYVSGGRLHLTITVIDTVSLRIKNCFVKTMPADQDRYQVLDSVIGEIAFVISKDLPLLGRDAVVKKQTISRLREKLDLDAALLDKVIGNKNEILILPLIGIHLGRSIIAWSDLRPLLAFPLGLEYSFFFYDHLHLRIRMEYLPLNIMAADTNRTEAGIDILFGIHTRSLFSFSLDSGFALTYDDNSGATALSSGEDEIDPHVKRVSLGIPVIFGLSYYFHERFFLTFRFASYGLSWTIETSPLSEYTGGSSQLKYYYGFSPLSILCLSLTASVGIRF